MCIYKVGDVIISASKWLTGHRRHIKLITAAVLIAGYFAFLTYACLYDFNSALELLIITVLVLLYFVYALIRDKFGDKINNACISPCCGVLQKRWYIIRWPLYVMLVAGLVAYLIWEAYDHPPQLMSALGACVFVTFGFVFSKHPSAVRWRPVLWGLGLQFIFAVFILRTKVGFDIFKWIGDFAQLFLSFSNYGAEFVFGADYTEHFFAFVVSNSHDIAHATERNVLEAAANGASQAVALVANIIANLIAFIALLALFNAFLGWMGNMVGIDDLSFELICSYVFAPISFLIGIEWNDCQIVAALIGTKLFINEFVAYEKLAELINNRENGIEPSISYRSEVIATYVLCGFDNLSSIGIQLGGLTPMAPSRKGELASIAVRALIAGTLTCFMTACVAGLLYTDFDTIDSPTNSTNITQLV
ncbi:solute carrier family 28 member 3-like [Saccoglossus kowalevskii]